MRPRKWPANPVSILGDVWVLGRHRLLCGDSTAAADVKRVLGTVQPHLMVTDPPYGVAYDPSWRARRGVGSRNLAQGKVLNDDRADWRQASMRCLPEMSLTSGMGRCMATSSAPISRLAGCSRGRRSSGSSSI